MLQKLIERAEKNYIKIFGLGTTLIIVGVALSFINIFIDNEISRLTNKIDAWNANFMQVIRNQEATQSLRDVEIIIQEIDETSDKIEKLREAQKDHMLIAIRIRYFTIYDKPLPPELQIEWEKLTLKELERLNNLYAEEFRRYHNNIIESRDMWETIQAITIILSAEFNVIGLLMIFLADFGRIKKQQLPIMV